MRRSTSEPAHPLACRLAASLLLLGVSPMGLCHAQAPVPSAQAGAPAGPIQNTQNAQNGYTLTVRSQLVQLDVVVRNAKGDLVQGLHAGDFTVTEDGVAQKVASFETTTPRPAAERPAEPINSTAELDKREPEAPVTLLVLDEITTRFEDQYFARYSLEKYLSKQGEALDQPTTLIARNIDRTMVLSDYTTSKSRILEALNRHFAGNDWRADNANFNDVKTSAAFASLLQVAKASQGHAGHKNLVWIGRGFPTLNWQQMPPDQTDQLRDAVSKCVNLLRDARITLYVIDPAGVQGLSGTLDDNGMMTVDDPFSQQVSFDALARATGGVSMHGRNDVDHLIGDAVADGEKFYTLTYRPSSPVDSDPKKFRKILVTLKDASLVATAREGYYPVADQPPPPTFADAKGKLTEGTMFDLASASTGLMVFDGIPLTLDRQGPDKNEVQISFPASSAGLTLSDGKLRGDVTLIALSFDKSGKPLTKDGRVLTLHLAPLSPGEAESRSIHITSPINVQLPIARVRIVVRSNATGRIGADNLYFLDPATLKDKATGRKPQ